MSLIATGTQDARLGVVTLNLYDRFLDQPPANPEEIRFSGDIIVRVGDTKPGFGTGILGSFLELDMENGPVVDRLTASDFSEGRYLLTVSGPDGFGNVKRWKGHPMRGDFERKAAPLIYPLGTTKIRFYDRLGALADLEGLATSRHIERVLPPQETTEASIIIRGAPELAETLGQASFIQDWFDNRPSLSDSDLWHIIARLAIQAVPELSRGGHGVLRDRIRVAPGTSTDEQDVSGNAEEQISRILIGTSSRMYQPLDRAETELRYEVAPRGRATGGQVNRVSWFASGGDLNDVVNPNASFPSFSERIRVFDGENARIGGAASDVYGRVRRVSQVRLKTERGIEYHTEGGVLSGATTDNPTRRDDFGPLLARERIFMNVEVTGFFSVTDENRSGPSGPVFNQEASIAMYLQRGQTAFMAPDWSATERAVIQNRVLSHPFIHPEVANLSLDDVDAQSDQESEFRAVTTVEIPPQVFSQGFPTIHTLSRAGWLRVIGPLPGERWTHRNLYLTFGSPVITLVDAQNQSIEAWKLGVNPGIGDRAEIDALEEIETIRQISTSGIARRIYLRSSRVDYRSNTSGRNTVLMPQAQAFERGDQQAEDLDSFSTKVEGLIGPENTIRVPSNATNPESPLASQKDFVPTGLLLNFTRVTTEAAFTALPDS